MSERRAIVESMAQRVERGRDGPGFGGGGGFSLVQAAAGLVVSVLDAAAVPVTPSLRGGWGVAVFAGQGGGAGGSFCWLNSTSLARPLFPARAAV